jgi:hypothetical protein
VTWAAVSARLALRSLLNPALGVALLRICWRFRRRNWVARFPFLPVPPAGYLQWRMYTAYGDDNAVPPVEDIIRYARWATSR